MLPNYDSTKLLVWFDYCVCCEQAAASDSLLSLLLCCSLQALLQCWLAVISSGALNSAHAR
jgi:hypothetical protein